MKTYKIILKDFFTDEISEVTYHATDWEEARVKCIAIREEMRASDTITNIQEIIDIETGETFHNHKIINQRTMKTFTSSTSIYSVTQNADGTLNVIREYCKAGGKWVKDGSPIKNAGMFINQQGGVSGLLGKCRDDDNLHERVAEFNEGYAARCAEAIERKRKLDEEREAMIKAEYNRVFFKDITETNQESVSALIHYLNTMNWGMWRLPKMTIGYQCNQYDCDGKTATTIKLDAPINVNGEIGTMFETGAPFGHLTKYRSI